MLFETAALGSHHLLRCLRSLKGRLVPDAHTSWIIVVQFNPHLDTSQELGMFMWVGSNGYKLPVSPNGLVLGRQAETVEDIEANSANAPSRLLLIPVCARAHIF